MTNPELEGEQRYVDHAYERLEAMHAYAQRIVNQASARHIAPPGPERDAFMRAGLARAKELTVGYEPLVFGRIDRRGGSAGRSAPGPTDRERLYIGRTAVYDESHEPLVTDWRAPASEAFYRATPLDPMGVIRRRHLICRGPKVTRLDDELLDADHVPEDLVLVGEGALLDAVRRSRTGRMRDIVATIQREQDAVIRAPLEGVLVVQGGPGTGKTAVALHRAAYLLYAHRDKLQSTGVLLVGPNPIFLHYIDQVLPSLGETAMLATITELVPGVAVEGDEPLEVARLKGDPRMTSFVRNAVARLPHELQEPAVIVYEGKEVTLTVAESRRLVRFARQRLRGRHNARRRRLAPLIVEYLWEKWSKREKQWVSVLGAEGRRHFMETVIEDPIFRATVDAMWPAMSASDFVRTFLFAESTLAATESFTAEEKDALVRRRPELTLADLALIDEADVHLGPLRSPKAARRALDPEDRFMIERMLDDLQESQPMIRSMRGLLAERYADLRLSLEEPVDRVKVVPERFGHVIVDEAQGLSPMQWRMIARRCPSKSMTVLGDLGQASSAWVPKSWEEALSEVAPQALQLTELTINYRTPGEIMDLAARVLALEAPDLTPPQSVRRTDAEPVFRRVERDMLVTAAVECARSQGQLIPDGKIAIIAPEEITGSLTSELGVADSERHTAAMLDEQIAVLNVDDARGLEFDSVVIVEPAVIVASYGGGLRSLYVALTRSTQRLVVVYSAELPEGLV